MVIILLGLVASPTAKAENVTIAILGDSLVQGYGLPADQGFVPQMQHWLDAQGVDVTLINAGVSGDTTAGGLARIGWTLAPDVDALVVSLGGNDVLRGIDPAVAGANLNGILKFSREQNVPAMIIGIGAPENFGAPYRAAFQALYQDLAREYQAPLYPNFLSALLTLPDRRAVLRTHYQRDALHPNASGVAIIVGDMGPSIAKFVASLTP